MTNIKKKNSEEKQSEEKGIQRKPDKKENNENVKKLDVSILQCAYTIKGKVLSPWKYNEWQILKLDGFLHDFFFINKLANRIWKLRLLITIIPHRMIEYNNKQ